MLLFEQQCGLSPNGNLYYLAKYILDSPQYNNMRLYFSVDVSTYESIKEELERRAFNVVILIKRTREYYRILAQARYIFFDTSLTPEYAKKEGQILVNTWHGTPIKTLGRRTIGEEHTIGNVQRSFFLSDYILYPNTFSIQCFSRDYMYHSISRARPLISGYPRNIPLMQVAQTPANSKKNVYKKHERTYAYMPTFRTGKNDLKHNNLDEIQSTLAKMDEALYDNEILYIQPHPIVAHAMDYSHYNHIAPFPKGIETYEFLSTVDVLISDYSSVIFDFALTRKKIILYTYDLDDYIKTRGLYLDITALPFPQVKNVSDLIKEMRSEKTYDESSLLATYSAFDSPHVCDHICQQVLDNKPLSHKREDIQEPIWDLMYAPRKKNIAFIFEQPPSHYDLLEGIDIAKSLTSKWQPIFLLDDVTVKKYQDIFQTLDLSIYYFPYKQRRIFDFKELIFHGLYAARIININHLNEARLHSSTAFEYAQLFPKGTFDEVFLYPSSKKDPLFIKNLE